MQPAIIHCVRFDYWHFPLADRASGIALKFNRRSFNVRDTGITVTIGIPRVATTFPYRIGLRGLMAR
jgi:hypothetical protein